MLQGLVVLFVGIAAWLLQIRLTWVDNFFTPKQMLEYHGKGLPMLWHFGIMWGDPIFITPLVAIVVGVYGWQWTWKQVLTVAAASLVLNLVMHFQYLQDKIQNSHMHDGKLTPATYVHFFYGWGGFTIIGLFFLCTVGVPRVAVMSAAALLWVHMVLGTHLFVKLLSPEWFTPNQPPADTITLAVWAGAAAILSGFSWYNIRFMH